MATTGYTGSIYYSIPDAAGMTLPNGDWTWIYTVRTGASIAVQDITMNGVYQAANTLNLYTSTIGGDAFRLNLSGLHGTDDTVGPISTNTWYVVTITRDSGQLDLRMVPFGSTSVTTGTGLSISAAYDSTAGYLFGIGEDLSFPFGGGMGDAIFIPGVALSDTDMSDIATGTAMDSTAWWASREFHLIMSDGTDHTGNHTVTTQGSPSALADPVQLVRFTNQAAAYSSGNWHSVPDDPDFILPDGDFTWLYFVRTTTFGGGSSISGTGSTDSANDFVLIQGGTGDEEIEFNTNDASPTGVFTGSIALNSWKIIAAKRSGTSMSVRQATFGNASVSGGSAATLNVAVNSPRDVFIGRRGGSTNPYQGEISDVLFVPGVAISDSDIGDIATGTALDSFSWYGTNVVYHFTAFASGTQLDETGNHTTTANGTVALVSGPSQLVRSGGSTPINVAIGLSTETDSALTVSSQPETTVIVGLVSETDSAQSVNLIQPVPNNATTSFSTTNYFTVEDDADFTYPNTDWSEILILRPDSVTGTQQPLSNGQALNADTRNFVLFDGTFDYLIDGGIGLEVPNATIGNWFILCAQRSGTTVTLRSIPAGTTTVGTSGGQTLNAAINPLSSNYIGRDRISVSPDPFTGAISDWLFIPGETISDADLQSMATGTAIDSFSWYSSAVFWAVLQGDTATDHIGSKTITEVGTLTQTTASDDVVRFGEIAVNVNQGSETNSAFAITWSKSLGFSPSAETDISQIIIDRRTFDFGLSSETDSAQVIDSEVSVIVEQAIETDTAQLFNLQKNRSFGLSAEADIGQNLTKQRSYDVPLAIDTNISQIVVPQVQSIVNLFPADEVDIAQITNPNFPTIKLSIISEIDTGQIITANKDIPFLFSMETDIAFSNNPTKSIPILLVAESDISQSFDFFKILSFGLSSEVDTGFQVTKIGGAADILVLDNGGIKILIDDRIKNATLSATSTATGFNVDNLKVDTKNTIWRSTSLSTQVLTATWGTAQTLSGVGFIFSNLIVGSTIVLRLFANSGDSQAFAQTPTINVNFSYEVPHGFSSIGYLSFPFGGGNYVSTFFPESSVGKIQATVTSPSNPDGYMELARLVAGPVISLQSESDYGASVGQIDRTIIDRADGGDLVINRGDQSKELKLPLGKLTRNDTALYNSIIRAIGRDTPIFVSALGNSPNNEDVTSYQIYGKRNKDLGISPISHNRAASTLIISEI